MKYVYVDKFTEEEKNILKVKQAFSFKNADLSLWLLDPGFKEFSKNVSIVLKNDVVTFSYLEKEISFKVIQNYDFVYKIRFFKSFNKFYSNNIQKLLEDLEKNNLDDYIKRNILQIIYKKMFNIEYDSLYMIDLSYANSLLEGRL